MPKNKIAESFRLYLLQIGLTEENTPEGTIKRMQRAYYRGIGDAMQLIGTSIVNSPKLTPSIAADIMDECANYCTDEYIKHTFGYNFN